MAGDARLALILIFQPRKARGPARGIDRKTRRNHLVARARIPLGERVLCSLPADTRAQLQLGTEAEISLGIGAGDGLAEVALRRDEGIVVVVRRRGMRKELGVLADERGYLIAVGTRRHALDALDIEN